MYDRGRSQFDMKYVAKSDTLKRKSEEKEN